MLLLCECAGTTAKAACTKDGEIAKKIKGTERSKEKKQESHANYVMLCVKRSSVIICKDCMLL